MGLRLKIEGSESVNLPETSIERVKCTFYGSGIKYPDHGKDTGVRKR